jgi:hypothetical protein
MEPYNFIEICANGQIFCPAEQHYPRRSVRSVSCDRCRRGNLEACKGIAGHNIDLCIACAAQIENNPSNQATIQRVRMGTRQPTTAYITSQPPAAYMTSPPNYIPRPQQTIGVVCAQSQFPYAVVFFPR